jgi:hypothetical protein
MSRAHDRWRQRLDEIVESCSERGWCGDYRHPDAGEIVTKEAVDRAAPIVEALAAQFWFCIYPTGDGGLYLEHFDQQERRDRAWLPSVEIDFEKNEIHYHTCEMGSERQATYETNLDDPNATAVLTLLLMQDREKNAAKAGAA